jgi:hypothetical protein
MVSESPFNRSYDEKAKRRRTKEHKKSSSDRKKKANHRESTEADSNGPG